MASKRRRRDDDTAFDKKRARSTAGSTTRAKKKASGLAGFSRRQRMNLRSGGFVGMELKYKDTIADGLAIASSTDGTGQEVDPPTWLCLNGVARADSPNGRDGRQVHFKSIFVNGVVDCPALVDKTGIDPLPVIFIALVLDTQTNQAQMNSEDVYYNPVAQALTAASVIRNMQFSTRFKVLKDWTLDLGPSSGAYNGSAAPNIQVAGRTVPFKCYLPLGDMVTTWDISDTSGYCTSIQDNSLHLVAYASQSGFSPTISYTARVRFRG